MAAERQECLATLGLSSSATEDEIKRAYRKLALQFHPDKNSDADAKSKFQQISYAYKYLTEGPDNVNGVDPDQHDVGQFFEQMFRDIFFAQYMFRGSGRFSPFCFMDDDDDDDDDDYYIFYSDSDDEPSYMFSQYPRFRPHRSPVRNNSEPTDPKVNKKKQNRKMKNKRQRERQKEKKQSDNARPQKPQSARDVPTSNVNKNNSQTKETNHSTTQEKTTKETSASEQAQNDNEQKMREREKKKEEEKEKRRIAKEAKESVANMLKKQKEKDEREKEKQRMKKEQEKDDISDWFFDDVHKSKKTKQKERKAEMEAQQNRQNGSGDNNLSGNITRQANRLADLNINRNNSCEPDAMREKSDQYNNTSTSQIKYSTNSSADKRFKNRFDILEEERFQNIIHDIVDDDDDDDDEVDDDDDDDDDAYATNNQNHSKPQAYKNGHSNFMHSTVNGCYNNHVNKTQYQNGVSSQKQESYQNKAYKKGAMQSEKNQKPRVFTSTKYKDNNIQDDIYNGNPQRDYPTNKSAQNGHHDVNQNHTGFNAKLNGYDNSSASKSGRNDGTATHQNGGQNRGNSNTQSKNIHGNRNYNNTYQNNMGYNHVWEDDQYNPYYMEDFMDYGYRGQYQPFRGHRGGFRGYESGFRGHPNSFRGHPNGFRGHPQEFRGYPNGFRGHSHEFRGHPNGFRGHPHEFRGHQNPFRGHPNGFRGHPAGYGVHQNGFRDDRSNRGNPGFRGRGHPHYNGFQPQSFHTQPQDREMPNNQPNKPYKKIGQGLNSGYEHKLHVQDDLSDSVSSLDSLNDREHSSYRRDSIDSISDDIQVPSNQIPSNIRSGRNSHGNTFTRDKLDIPNAMFHNDRVKNYYK